MAIGDGASLKVDPDLLSRLGSQLETAAAGLPDAPEPFVVSGTDPISLAIAGRLPDVEGGIQEALPQVKADATRTASNVISAAGQYKGTDEQLAAEYEKHQFDQAGSSGTASSAGGGGDAMSQMLSMPMQMASQAVQMPMQAMSAVASLPQAAMQAVQQVGQMTGGLGKSDGDVPDAQGDSAEQAQQGGAAGGAPGAERAPDAGSSSAPVRTPASPT